MSFRSSSARQVEQLVASLGSSSPVERDSAVARLIVIGERAVERLLPVVANAQQPVAAKAALTALEAMADPRALAPIVAAMDRDDVAAAAIQAARAYLGGRHGAHALDAITAVALDERRPEHIRLAALQAVRGVGRRTARPVLKRLETDPSAAVQAAARAKLPADRDPAGVLADAVSAGVGDDPEALKTALAVAGADAPLSTLQQLVDRIRERETSEPAARRPLWMAVRGAAHAALARRSSRIALYDLRESLEAATAPLPVDFLAAVLSVGDPSCLEAIAAAFSRSAAASEEWWRRHLAEAFREIAKRHGITRRHAVMKKIEKRYANGPTI